MKFLKVAIRLKNRARLLPRARHFWLVFLVCAHSMHDEFEPDEESTLVLLSVSLSLFLVSFDGGDRELCTYSLWLH
jgi:hypothetical protein